MKGALATVVLVVVVAVVTLFCAGCGYNRTEDEKLEASAKQDAKALVGQVVWPPKDSPQDGVENSGQGLWHVRLVVIGSSDGRIFYDVPDTILAMCRAEIITDTGWPINQAVFERNTDLAVCFLHHVQVYYGQQVNGTYRHLGDIVASDIVIPPSTE